MEGKVKQDRVWHKMPRSQHWNKHIFSSRLSYSTSISTRCKQGRTSKIDHRWRKVKARQTEAMPSHAYINEAKHEAGIFSFMNIYIKLDKNDYYGIHK